MFRVALVIAAAAAACATPRPTATRGHVPAAATPASPRWTVAREPLRPKEGAAVALASMGQSTQMGHGLVGQVWDARTGDPLPGVLVFARDRAGQTWPTASLSDGTYALHELPAGTYDVTYLFADLEGRIESVVIATGRATQIDVLLDVSLAGMGRVFVELSPERSHPLADRPGDSIVALVVDARDAPLAGALVQARSETGLFEALTDRDGQARLSWLRPGRYDVSVSLGAVSAAIRGSVVESGSRLVLRVSLPVR